jgi:hypothetical protein
MISSSTGKIEVVSTIFYATAMLQVSRIIVAHNILNKFRVLLRQSSHAKLGN